MPKIAIVEGSWMKDAKEPIKKLYIDGELQGKIEEFSKDHKIIDIKPVNNNLMMITYEG